VDEACSGVRSLQTALMVSLFLGELYRLTVLRRTSLIVASLGFVLLANLGRTCLLVWAAATHGFDRMHGWHDAAGTAVMLIVLPGLLGLAALIRPRNQTEPQGSAEPVRLALPLPWLVGALVWLVAVEGLTEWWYRQHEASLVDAARWTVTWPVAQNGYREMPIPENAQAILRCNEHQGAAWRDDSGNTFMVYFLRWDPGRNSAQLAKGHRPEICLPGTGAKLIEDLGDIQVELGTLTLPFRQYVFEARGGTLHVFYCLWPDRVSRQEHAIVEDGSLASRLEAVRLGKRHVGQRVLEVAIAGPTKPEQGLQALQEQLPTFLRIEPR
jgi:exosortase/archaeosortase family protein